MLINKLQAALAAACERAATFAQPHCGGYRTSAVARAAQVDRRALSARARGQLQFCAHWQWVLSGVIEGVVQTARLFAATRAFDH